MDCKIKNDMGTIYIAEDVMLKVVGYAALECYGIVAMSSKRAKDGLVEWLGRENLSKGVQLRMVDDQLDVDLFIVVEYGISVAEVCKTIVEVVRYKLEGMTGVKVRSVIGVILAVVHVEQIFEEVLETVVGVGVNVAATHFVSSFLGILLICAHT